MPRVLFFGPAAEATGTRQAEVPGSSVAEVVASAVARYGDPLAELLPTCRVWVNGEPADDGAAVRHDDEVAVLPPVSGG